MSAFSSNEYFFFQNGVSICAKYSTKLNMDVSKYADLRTAADGMHSRRRNRKLPSAPMLSSLATGNGALILLCERGKLGNHWTAWIPALLWLTMLLMAGAVVSPPKCGEGQQTTSLTALWYDACAQGSQGTHHRLSWRITVDGFPLLFMLNNIFSTFNLGSIARWRNSKCS